MPGDVGLVAKLADTLIGAFLDEDKIPEIIKRRKLRAKKEECRKALIDNDFDRLRVLTDELRELANKP